jgi:hypothetical protein
VRVSEGLAGILSVDSPLAPSARPAILGGMYQQHEDYAEDGGFRRGRRLDWEHGMAPVWLFVSAACAVVFGIDAWAYFGYISLLP